MTAGSPADFQLATILSDEDEAVGFLRVISDAHGRLVETSAEAYDTEDEARRAGEAALGQRAAAPG